MAYKIVNFKLYDINVSVIYIAGYKTRILVGKKLDNVKPVDSDNTSFLLNYSSIISFYYFKEHDCLSLGYESIYISLFLDF